MTMSSRSNFFGLSLRDLDILRRLLVERSVSGVATQLGQSQPAVSATLRRLRDIFGDPLLVRSGQRMVLTEKGMMVSAQVEGLINGFVELLGVGRDIRSRHLRAYYSHCSSDFVRVLFGPSSYSRVA